MSILIKGLDMPRHGMVINIYADGRVSNHFDEFCEKIATAVPVPPHGRLIDADALENEHMKRAYENFRSYQFHVTATAWINDAPTIIPAEEGE